VGTITRIWHGKTKAEDADRYLEFLERSGVPDYLKTEGNLSVKILRRIEGDICHFWTVTEWDSIESVRRFAGDEIEKAKYYPEDKEFLLEFEPVVKHCETFEY
jgi:heme-degrading monooxygenase HmoA